MPDIDLRGAAPPALLTLLLGVPLGAAWSVLAPTPEVRDLGGVLVSATEPEFQAAQDATFVGLAAAAGLVVGLALLVSRAGGRLPVALGALAGSAGGAVLAARVGAALGPPAIGVQGDAPWRAPLELAALGALAVWPATLAGTLFAGLLLTGLSAGDRGAHRAGEPQQVRRGQLDVQATSPRADQQRR